MLEFIKRPLRPVKRYLLLLIQAISIQNIKNKANIIKAAILFRINIIKPVILFRINIIKVAIFVQTKKKIKIIIGAAAASLGHLPCYKGWVFTEYVFFDVVKKHHWQRLLWGRKVDRLLAEHVWEHINPDDAIIALKHCHHFMAKGAIFRIAVPDGYHPDKKYIEWVRPGGNGPGADDHRILYTIDDMRVLAKKTNFTLRAVEYWDDKKKFHAHPWDEKDGMVRRSFKNDDRNKDGKPNYTSLIVDFIKE